MSKPVIQIGNVEVTLADYAVGAAAVLGIRDSGKTVTSKGIAEQLIDHGIPIVVFDAVGKWRWMKVPGAQSGGRGYKVVVAGGRGPDLPLTPHSVTEIVRSALKERIPLIIDLYDKNLSKADWRQIVQKAIRIIHYENEGGAVHVFLEEAAEFVPQRVDDGQTYAEVEKLVRMGGNASVGITLINQRSQEINKAVLDNCSTALVLGCQVGKNAIEAVSKWVERLDPETAKELTTSLPRLGSGEAWVWTRKSLDKPTREKMPMCRSLHPDRRTPEVILKSAKATDTAEFVARMANSIPKVIEEAKANDPAELKRKLRELERELAKKPVTIVESKTPEKEPVPVFDQADRDLLARVIETYGTRRDELVDIYESLSSLQTKIISGLSKFTASHYTVRVNNHVGTVSRARVVSRPVPPSSNGNGQEVSHASGGLRRMMIALAQRPGINKRQLGVRAGLAVTGGSFGTYLSKLRTNQWISENGSSIELTGAGAQALGTYALLPEGRDLLNYWLGELGEGGAGRMLRVLAENYPGRLTKQELGDATQIEHTGGTFGTYVSKLRTLELIEGKSELSAAKEFFE